MHSYNILHRLVTPRNVYEYARVWMWILWFIFSIYSDFNFSSNFSEISAFSLPVTRYADQNNILTSNSNMVLVKAASTERFLKTIP